MMLLVAALLLGAASAGVPATPQESGEKNKVLDDVLMLKRARSPDDDPYDKETLREGKASPPDCLAFLFQGAGRVRRTASTGRRTARRGLCRARSTRGRTPRVGAGTPWREPRRGLGSGCRA